MALLLLDRGADLHAAVSNGRLPLHDGYSCVLNWLNQSNSRRGHWVAILEQKLCDTVEHV